MLEFRLIVAHTYLGVPNLIWNQILSFVHCDIFVVSPSENRMLETWIYMIAERVSKK